ncbi:hypothetical protein BDP27DRAFT_489751 [Rhodocollybia butyracea]|uniref:Uncharacterized protein n=1 Tax=Rhodocollybia butyracea TaxID=206335 RepID=A0A9P5QBY8_9AGAR|nr:hypothetical protein BDP27DRAFT_489751 [Rhodocollybia butyracea]
MLEDLPESEGWVDCLDLALRVPSGLYDKNIPIAMYRWVTKHHSYLTYCCIYTLDLNNPSNRHKSQDCVEVDMMVSAPDEKGRYRFTPLATKRTSWEEYYSRRNDYDSTNGDAVYAACKEKNKVTSHNGKPGVACIVMLSLRSEIALTLPMFFSHDDMTKKELENWDVKNYKFLEKTAF